MFTPLPSHNQSRCCEDDNETMELTIEDLDSYLHEDTHCASTHHEDEEDDNTVNVAFQNFIQSLRNADEESYNRGDRFSRACRACNRDHPDRRVVSLACLHVVCAECAAFAYSECPLCRVPTTFATLFEDPRSPRACSSCYWPSPAERALLSACGHAVCRACAWEMNADAKRRGADVCCSVCEVPSPLISLEEELIEDVDSITARFASMEH